MRTFEFLIDDNGVEYWCPIDIDKKTEWYGGYKCPTQFMLIRAIANKERNAYFCHLKIDKKTEKKLVKILGEERDWLKGKKYIEKKTKGLGLMKWKLFIETMKQEAQEKE